MTPRRKPRVRLALLGLFVAGTGVLAGGFQLKRMLKAPWRSHLAPSVLLEVPPRSTGSAVFRALQEGGVLRDRRLGLLALKIWFNGRSLKSGEYRFDSPVSPREVVARLVAGDVVTYRVTIPEGLTAGETFDLLVARGFGKREIYTRLDREAASLPDLPAGAKGLTGYLFPETYTFPKRVEEREVVSAMLRQFHRSLPERYEERAAGRGLSLPAAVTLASIVEKETALAAERPLVAGVYLNRLSRGMLLQADPTTVFSLKRLGRWYGTLTRADLELDDPWNTYRVAGLPPGPICSPGRAALEATASPVATDALYFVATGTGDGGHRFAPDWEGHEKNVASFRRAQRRSSEDQLRAAGR